MPAPGCAKSRCRQRLDHELGHPPRAQEVATAGLAVDRLRNLVDAGATCDAPRRRLRTPERDASESDDPGRNTTGERRWLLLHPRAASAAALLGWTLRDQNPSASGVHC
jgi:hypothetical protein